MNSEKSKAILNYYVNTNKKKIQKINPINSLSQHLEVELLILMVPLHLKLKYISKKIKGFKGGKVKKKQEGKLGCLTLKNMWLQILLSYLIIALAQSLNKRRWCLFLVKWMNLKMVFWKDRRIHLHNNIMLNHLIEFLVITLKIRSRMCQVWGVSSCAQKMFMVNLRI